MIAWAMPDFGFVQAWLAAMGRASLEGAVAIGLVWLVCRTLPRISPNVRCWLWRLALLKMLLAAVPLGSLDLPILPRSWTAADAPHRAAERASRPAAADLAAAASPTGDPSVSVDVSGDPRQPASSVGISAVSQTGRWPKALTLLFALWLLAVIGFAVAVMVRVRGTRRWRSDWRLVKDRDVLTLNERLAAELRLFQPPLLFEAENCESPVVFGAVRTAVVLPSQLMQQSTPAQLRLILAHEMAHIRRWDLLGNWFSTFVSGLFFFHPLVWLAIRESRLSQEMACDELAVRQPDVSVADYGRLLVELAARCPASSPTVAAVGVVESFHTFLKRRLTAMRTFGTGSRRILALSWCVAAIAVVGLLPWRLVAQTEEQERQEEKKAAAEHKRNSKSTSGKYTIVVDRIRREDNRTITMVPTGFPLFLPGQGTQHTETKNFAGGQTTTSSATMGGGATGGGAFRVPNLVLDVAVTSKKLDKTHQILCTPIGKVKAVDDQGHEADSQDSPGWMRLELAGVEYNRGPGRTALHIFLEDGDPPARYLKSVDGQLLVAEAIVGNVTFQGKDLSRPTKKSANGVAVKLEKVAQSPEGIEVKLAAAPPAAARDNVNPMANPMEHLQRSMLANSGGRLSVTVEDSEGETHSPKSTQDGGGNGSSSFSNFNSGGGGGGGGSSHSSGGWSVGGPGGQRSGNFSSGGPNDSTPSQTFQFDALPEGVKIKAIHCKVTDFTEPPKAVPYHFKDIQLP
jgi:beta-lactamase regulating signal transducer with metallopeptidase domain